MKYEMEELLPIVAALAEQYTSKESTSVSYEQANRLMEAVLYCIGQCSEGRQITDSRGLTAREAYEWGYELVVQKVKRTQEIYNGMIIDFCAYGNDNYRETVGRAIPGFFRYYDAKFAPRETIITMDYPTIRPITDATGINAIAKYIEYISYEQRFLKALPQEYVCDILFRFRPDYGKQFYNICNIVLRHILGHMIIGEPLGKRAGEEEYAALSEWILEREAEHLEKLIMELLHQLIFEKYKGDQMLECYLQADIRNFMVEMQNAARNNIVKKVVVM